MRKTILSRLYGYKENKMATTASGEETGNGRCLLVRPSPDTSLYFASASDYIQHLITHGDCYGGARVEPLAPSGSHLQSGMARPTKTASSERPETSGSKDSAVVSVQAAVLSGRASLVRTAVKQCSATAALDSTDEQGLTPLLHAALTGAHDITAVLLKAGASPDIAHAMTGATALSLACLHGHTDIVKLLLKHKCGLAEDQHGCSPLHCAVWGGSGKSVKALLSHRPALATARDCGGRTALHLAAAKGDVELCQLLAKRGCGWSETDSQGRTPLHWAILSLKLSCVERLLSTGCSSLCNQPDSCGAIPVHYAAMTGQCDLLTALVDKGGAVDVKDNNGHTPLLWACACGHVDSAGQLIQLTSRGIPSLPSSEGKKEMQDLPTDEGGRCLRAACAVGSLDVCQLLLQTTPTLVRAADEAGRTALHEASYHGHTDCLDEALEAGATPNSATLTDHRTSLHVASERGHCEVVASLLAAGASYNCPTHPDGEREQLATSLLLDELQAQSQHIRLPLPTSPKAPRHTSTHKVPATAGYLLQASEPLPASDFSSSVLFTATCQRKPLLAPRTRPRRPLPTSPRSKHPPQSPPPPSSPPSQSPTSPNSPPSQSKKDEGRVKLHSMASQHTVQLPAVSSQPVVSSNTQRPSQTAPPRKRRQLSESEKASEGSRVSVRKSQSSVEGESEKLPVIAGVSGLERRESVDGGLEEMETERRNEEGLPPLPLTPSLVSPPSLTSPPPRPTPPQSPAEENPTHSLTAGDELAVQETGRPASAKGDTILPEKETKTPRGSEFQDRRYLKQTMFRTSILRDHGLKQPEGGATLDSRLLGPIQRYDRLNQVLGLLRQVQGTAEREGAEKVRLTDLRQHIQSALDEAVRLRADTESLEHVAKVRLSQKATAAASSPTN